ncbi:MAG TPA: hypothetical protein VMT75_01555 [Candidatus Saccharimonadales bacterium]|nr:hypothetical protein [Candidatus Saccharimonadales bacterium]
MESTSSQVLCGASNCDSNSVIILSGQDLCLEHFLVKCYERLDWVESIARSRRLETDVAAKARELLFECANQTLVVCLGRQPLNNLERSRLLEIMLQCNDLQVQLRRPTLQPS